jgi:hypothetical protein
MVACCDIPPRSTSIRREQRNRPGRQRDRCRNPRLRRCGWHGKQPSSSGTID